VGHEEGRCALERLRTIAFQLPFLVDPLADLSVPGSRVTRAKRSRPLRTNADYALQWAHDHEHVVAYRDYTVEND